MFRTILHAIANTLFFLSFLSAVCELFDIHVPIFDWMYPANEGKDLPPGMFAYSIRTIVFSLYVTYRMLILDKPRIDKLEE